MLYQSYLEKLQKRKRIFDGFWRFRLLFLAAFLTLLAGAGALMGVKGITYGERIAESFVYGAPVEAEGKCVFGDASFEYRAAGEKEWTREVPYLVGDYECRAVAESVVGSERKGDVLSFSILPAPVTVTVASDRYIYGVDLVYEADLKYGDTLSVEGFLADEANGSLAVRADPEEIHIFDGNGNDVTYCYEIETPLKQIAGKRRGITVKTQSVSFVYDGSAHSASSFEIGGLRLAEGHTAQVVCSSFTEVGEYPNRVESFAIYDEEHKDVTERYEVNYEYGTVSVERRKISVTTPSEEFVYDGETHTYPSAALSSGTLAGGEELAISDVLSVSEAGAYENRPQISVFRGGEDVTKNYEIETVYGQITVLRRAVTVRSSDGEWVYDGAPHSSETFEVTEGQDFLETIGHTVECTDFFSITNVGTRENELTVNVFDDSHDRVTKNYVVSCIGGTLSVTPRKVTLTTGSAEGLVYNGMAQSKQDCYDVDSEQKLVTGHSVTADYKGFTEVGEHVNAITPENVRIYTSSHADVTKNYEIDWKFGTVVIVQRKLTVKTENSGPLVYNGKPQSYPVASDVTEEANGGLAAGHFISATPRAGAILTAPGKVKNELDIAVKDGSGADVTTNYEIAVGEVGDLEIVTLSLVLRTDDGKSVYDGKPHGAHGYTAAGSDILDGHEISVEWKDFVEAGNHENGIDESKVEIRDENGELVTRNYTIEWQFGTYTIDRRTLTVTTGSARKVYDGTPLFEEGCEIENVADGQTARLTVLSRPEIVYVTDGTRENTVIVSVAVTEGETDVTKNYDTDNIVYVYGSLQIMKRPVTVKTGSVSRVYDGDARPYEENWEPVYGEYEKLAGHEISLQWHALPSSDVGTYENGCTAFVAAGERDVTENYDIGYEFGEVTITLRPLSIIPKEAEAVYYDGAEHVYGGYDLLEGTTFAEGQSLFFDVGSEYIFKAAGFHEVKFAVGVQTVAGDVVTKNYEITFTSRTVEIKKRPIHVTTASAEWVYDGDAHSDAAFEVEALEGLHGLGEGDEARQTGSVPAVRNVWDSAGQNNVFGVAVFCGGENVSENYIITYAYGSLKITPRPLNVVTDSASWEYDDTEHTKETAHSSDLVKDHELELSGFTKVTGITERGTAENELAFSTFRVRTADGEDMTANYQYKSLEYGTLEILARYVTLRTNSATKVYDGEPLFARGYTVVKNSLVEGHELRATYREERNVPEDPNQTNYPNDFTDTPRIFRGETDVTRNYEIAWEYGTLTIERRELLFTTHSNEWMYDGTKHSEFTFDYSNQVAGQVVRTSLNKNASTVVTDYTPEPVNNVLTLSFTVSIDDEMGRQVENVTRNYVAKYEYGKLTVTKRPITVTSKDATWVYDGTQHIEQNDKRYYMVTYPEGAPAIEGHAVYVTFHDLDRLKKTYGNEFNLLKFDVTITDGSAHNVTENYECTKNEAGHVIIAPRPVTITTGSHTWVYDGAAHSWYAQGTFTVERGVMGQEGSGFIGDPSEFDFVVETSSGLIAPTSVKDITDLMENGVYTKAGYVKNEFRIYIIWDKNGSNYFDSYTITYEYGELRVKSPIEVLLGCTRREYNGEALTHNGYYHVMQKPPEVNTEDIAVAIDAACRVEVFGAYTLEDALAANLIHGTIMRDGKADEAALGENRFDFSGFVKDGEGKTVLLEITRRTVRIASQSISREKDGNVLFGRDAETPYTYSNLLAGHTLTCTVTGTLAPDASSAPNTIDESSVKVVDGEGRDVTGYYTFIFRPGTLSWLEAGG